MADDDSDQQFEIEKVIKRRKKGGKFEYFVKWKGFGDDDNSWEPANNLADCQRLMQACDAAIAEKAGPKKTKKIKPVVAVEDEFEVEAVINSRRGSGSVIQYLVKWKGYPKSQSTWQTQTDLANVKNLVADYTKAVALRTATKTVAKPAAKAAKPKPAKAISKRKPTGRPIGRPPKAAKTSTPATAATTSAKAAGRAVSWADKQGWYIHGAAVQILDDLEAAMTVCIEQKATGITRAGVAGKYEVRTGKAMLSIVKTDRSWILH